MVERVKEGSARNRERGGIPGCCGFLKREHRCVTVVNALYRVITRIHALKEKKGSAVRYPKWRGVTVGNGQ